MIKRLSFLRCKWKHVCDNMEWEDWLGSIAVILEKVGDEGMRGTKRLDSRAFTQPPPPPPPPPSQYFETEPWDSSDGQSANVNTGPQ